MGVQSCLPAELRVPVHGVDVEQHGPAGVGHVRAVDSARLPPGQTLQTHPAQPQLRQSITRGVSLQLYHDTVSYHRFVQTTT